MARKEGKDRGITFKRGKWWVRLYVNGREKWYRTSTKSQAKALYGRLKADVREGKYFRKEKPIPFRRLAEEYEAALDATRRGRIGDDRARIRGWIDVFGDQDARTITSDQVERAIHALQRKNYKPATIHRHFTVLKAILNRALALKQVRAEISQRVKLPKYDNQIVRYLSSRQEEALLDSLPARYRPIVVVALNTGLRQGELLRLRWQDIDWDIGMITVHQTKSGKPHRVPMNSKVQTILNELKNPDEPHSQDRIFPHHLKHLRRVFQKAVKNAGLEPFRFHDLRHTFASRLAMQGANDRTIMALGGWHSPAMLSRYAHLSPTHLWNAVERLGQMGTGTKTGTTRGEEKSEAVQPLEKSGEPPGTRTQGPRLKRAMLYRLS